MLIEHDFLVEYEQNVFGNIGEPIMNGWRPAKPRKDAF